MVFSSFQCIILCGLQVWQDEVPSGEDEEPAQARSEISQSQHVANIERAKQVVPAVQSQHETFKFASHYSECNDVDVESSSRVSECVFCFNQKGKLRGKPPKGQTATNWRHPHSLERHNSTITKHLSQQSQRA